MAMALAMAMAMALTSNNCQLAKPTANARS